MISIYGLCDPDTGEIRYIGKAKNPEKRFKQHLGEKRRLHYPVYCWIKSLRSKGKIPVLKTLTECSEDTWKQHEIDLIACHPNLLNVAAGGDEPYCSREIRQKNGRKVARAIQADPQRKRLQQIKLMISQSLKHGYCTDEVKEKLRYCAMKRPDLFACWANL